MRAEFDRLKSQGYTVSDIHGIVGCSLGPDTGQVELRFTRLTSDGGFMPPKDRTSLYKLRKFEDGWRVTGMSALPALRQQQARIRGIRLDLLAQAVDVRLKRVRGDVGVVAPHL